MIRLQRWESGPYFAAFSLHIPDMHSFLDMREIVNICTRSPVVSIKPVFRCRTRNSDRLLAFCSMTGLLKYSRIDKCAHFSHSKTFWTICRGKRAAQFQLVVRLQLRIQTLQA